MGYRRPEIIRNELGKREVYELRGRVLLEKKGYWPDASDHADRWVEAGSSGLLYRDAYDCHVSEDYGVRDSGGRLIASHRASRALDGVYLVERYLGPQGAALPAWLKDASPVELSRLVVDDESCRAGLVMLDLLVFEIEHFLAQGVRYIVTAAEFPHPGQMWLDLGMRRLGLPTFSMSRNDEHELTVLYADLTWPELTESLNRVKRILMRRQRREPRAA